MTNNLEERTIFAIEKDHHQKYVHFFGYGYYADDGTATPFRFVEYTWCYVPLDEVLEMGFEEAEAQYGPEVKQYITDCNEEQMIDIYEHYDNGNMPIVLDGKLTSETPCGTYIY